MLADFQNTYKIYLHHICQEQPESWQIYIHHSSTTALITPFTTTQHPKHNSLGYNVYNMAAPTTLIFSHTLHSQYEYGDKILSICQTAPQSWSEYTTDKQSRKS